MKGYEYWYNIGFSDGYQHADQGQPNLSRLMGDKLPTAYTDGYIGGRHRWFAELANKEWSRKE